MCLHNFSHLLHSVCVYCTYVIITGTFLVLTVREEGMANLLKNSLSEIKSYGEQVILHLHSPTFSAQRVHCKCACFNDPSSTNHTQ